MAIRQDLVDDGFVARYASVRRFVGTLRGASSPEAARRPDIGHLTGQILLTARNCLPANAIEKKAVNR